MKKVILLVLLVLAVVVAVFYGYKVLDKEKVASNSIGSGTVLEMKENSIVIQGYLESEVEEKKVIVVEFLIDSETVFKKTGMLVDVEKHSDGEPFTPEIIESEGSVSEIRARTVIKGVKTKDKLVDGGTARALEINYSGVIFQ